MQRKIKRSSSDFSFFAPTNKEDGDNQLLSFRSATDYPWLEEIWAEMTPIERINALLHQRDAKGRGLLIKAVRHLDYSLMYTLLENREMDVNQQDIYGNSALHHAAMLRDSTSLSILLASPRITACLVNRDRRAARELLLSDYMAYNDEIRVCCVARFIMDQTIIKYCLSHRKNVTLALHDPLLLKTLQETVRQRYETEWMLSEYRDRHFPLDLIPLALQNQIIVHHFTLYTA